MRPITQQDENLFATATLAVRMGRQDAVIERLDERYAEEWDDPSAGLPYVLAMVADLCMGSDKPESSGTYSEIVETLGDLVHAVPDHWLARYLRIWVRAVIPHDYRGYASFVAGERASARVEVDDLIAAQALVGWQPWFAATHVLAARMAGSDTHPDTARMAALIRAIPADDGRPVPFRSLGSLLCETFHAYCRQPDAPLRETVDKLALTLFSTRAGQGLW